MIDLSNQGLRCIAYDMRGHGRSSDPGRGYDFDTLADDLHTVIERFGLHETCLVGHSVSCGVIVRYLRRHGSSRLSRAVLISPIMRAGLNTEDNPQGIDRARPPWIKDFPRWLGENARAFFVPETSQEMVQFGIDMCLKSSLKALLDVNLAGMETDFRGELPKVTVPTLVIHGDHDLSVPVDRGRRTAQLIPGAEFKVYEGAPHGLMLTHIDRLNGDLLAFCKS
jgi:pimeloyl-ACP methyl ester carboxylesterase